MDLLSRAPRPPGEALPTGASDTEIDTSERDFGITFPAEFREMLKLSNGPCVGPGGLFGVGDLAEHLRIQSYLNMYPAWKQKGWLPIAGDGCGNVYVVATTSEYGDGFPVFFVETEINDSEPAYIAASNVESFVQFLLKKEIGESSWPYDENEVVTSDPDILRFRDVPLPWSSR